jgi:hypothetical protein
MGPIGCPETSVEKYHSALCNIPEERRSQLLGRFVETVVATIQVIVRVLPFFAVRHHSSIAPQTLIQLPSTVTSMVKILTSPSKPQRELHAAGPFSYSRNLPRYVQLNGALPSSQKSGPTAACTAPT